MPGRERGKYLYRIARLLQDRAREFAVAETLDGGKPIRESRDFDVPMAAAHFFYHAGWADKLEYVAPGRVAQPLGVVGQVIPWNFPLLMLAWKLAPALAMGNCVVLKPAETTSITALKLAEILQDAELPPGVVNFVTGAGETGAAVMGHPGAAKVAFTGSTEVGKAIMRQLAGTDRKMTMELGGKAANIVFDDAPIDQAVEGIVNGIFFNQGHVCCAGSRLLVHEPVAQQVISKLRNRVRVLRVGDPLDKNTDLGAINSREQLGRIRRLVASGVREGALMYQPPCRLPERGFYFPPTLFTRVTQSHRIAREETRATIFQDPWRTVQFLARFPELEFNGDFSHWYTGTEMVYGGFETKLEFIRPVLGRIGFLHGRIGNPCCMQVDVGDGSTGGRPYVGHFRALWTESFLGFLRRRPLFDRFCFAPELLGPTYYYARTFEGQEESDRWQQSLVLIGIAQECFAEARRRWECEPDPA